MFVLAFLLISILLSINSVRRHTAAASNNQASLESWYLSEVGQGLAWDGRAPPPGYDTRNRYDYDVSDRDDEMNGDYVVAYTNRCDHYKVLQCLASDRYSLIADYQYA